MGKAFYSGGFLYDPKSEKILLHKRDNKTKNNPDSWAFFGGLSKKQENPADTFIREIREELGLQLNLELLRTVTHYFNPDFNTHRYIFFAEAKEESLLTLGEGEGYGWFYLSDALQLDLTKRTKQDLQFFKKTLL